MFPGMGKINPKQMQAMMKQFGIKTDEINAKRAIFELEGGKKIVIEAPNVSAMTMQGQKTYTVMGGTETEQADGVPEEDIKMVSEQSGASMEKAKKALEETSGDIAEAIMKLKK